MTWPPVFLALMVASGAAQADSRLQAAEMSCSEVREVVQSRSAVVLGTGGRSFDRYFATRLLCTIQNADAVAATVATGDDPACRVGFLCRPRQDD